MIRLFRRISTSFFSGIDYVVGEIENHEALINATIAEQKKRIATAKVQLARLETNERKVAEKIAELKTNENRWKDRALISSERDEKRALQCLQRRKNLHTQINQLTKTQKEYEQGISRMRADIEKCEVNIRSLSQRHELMRARETSVKALSNTAFTSDALFEDIENSFDRWEIKIAQNEVGLNCDTLLDNNVDDLEQDFIDQENETELKAELEELIKESKDDES